MAVSLTGTQINDLVNDGILALPSGDFQVSTQIDVGTSNGLRIQGEGMTYAEVSADDKQATRLFWTGDPAIPMIVGNIRQGVFQDIQFVDGKIKIAPQSGFGTGLCFFDRVCFSGDNAGVIFGDVSYNGNAADSKFRDCQFNRCDTCIDLTTSQNVNYVIDGGLFYRCDRMLNIKGGGLITVRESYLTQIPVMFNITGNGTQVGSQNGNFSVRDVKYDASQDVKPTLVNDTGSYGANRVLSVTNVHAPPLGLDYVNSTGPTWKVQGVDSPVSYFPRVR